MSANDTERTVTVRQAVAADVAALAALRLDMDAERHQIPFDRDEYIAAFESAERAEIERGAHVAWIAEVDGAIVAAVLLIVSVMPPNFTELHRNRGFVSSVYCRPAYRRRGITRRLMEMLIEHAHEQKLQRLVLWASDMGRPLYESLGFRDSRGMELNL
jgi:ribosomal protein S18 acetylase RimI-like enzyme